MAEAVPSTDGVYFVPAFTGLGAPYWDPEARGAILGLTRGTTRAHLVRATLEAMAYQTQEVLECMQRESGIPLRELRVDGGAAENSFLMQFQSDVSRVPVDRPTLVESTGLGAAYLAGVEAGIWDPAQVRTLRETDRRFVPSMDEERRDALLAGWRKAVQRVLTQGGGAAPAGAAAPAPKPESRPRARRKPAVKAAARPIRKGPAKTAAGKRSRLRRTGARARSRDALRSSSARATARKTKKKTLPPRGHGTGGAAKRAGRKGR
jgi:hypothetical protein